MLDSLDNQIIDAGWVKSMPCISIPLHCSCAKHPPVICCPNVFLPDGSGSPSSSSSSSSLNPLLLHAHSSLPTSPSLCPSLCTLAMTIFKLCHVMSLNLAKGSKVLTPRPPISYWRLFSAAHASSAQPRTTSREWQGASLLVTVRSHFQTMSTHPLCDGFGLVYFMMFESLLEGSIFFYQTLHPDKF